MYNTDYYLNEISEMSNRFGDKLLELMAMCNKNRLADITYEEAKSFYEKLGDKKKYECYWEE